MVDVNSFTTPFQFTKAMHRDIYPAIDPKNHELSAAGKTILITGATGGVGGEVARAWATAGAKAIILIGRKTALLDEPSQAIKSISPTTEVLALTTDLTSETEVEATFKEAIDKFGNVDVVVHAAALAVDGSAGTLDPTTWFSGFEVNVKGSYILAHYYLRAVEKGTLIFLGTLGASFIAPGLSSYSASKLALVRFAENLNVEQPGLRVFTVHPGIVQQTESGRGGKIDAFAPFAKDKGIQTGGLSLYLAQPKADFLRGSFLSVNWDVEEMEAHKAEIVEKNLLKTAFLHATLGPEGHPWSS